MNRYGAYLHGEAVSIGITMAADLSFRHVSRSSFLMISKLKHVFEPGMDRGRPLPKNQEVA